MLNHQTIWNIALTQSAWDAGCAPDDFLKTENVIVESHPSEKARRYLELPFDCHLISYGYNVVASINLQYEKEVRSYLDACPVVHCFETPNLYRLNAAFAPYDRAVCFMAEYFLPDVSLMKPLSCGYELRVLLQEDLQEYYTPAWSNALCEKRKELDVLAVGAFEGSRLIGLAGCSADGEDMWQIGIDVLPEFRRQGIASALTSRLAVETLEREKVPFYCCAWSNIGSARNAIRSGFRPAWAEMTVKTKAFIEKMNQENMGKI